MNMDFELSQTDQPSTGKTGLVRTVFGSMKKPSDTQVTNHVGKKRSHTLVGTVDELRSLLANPLPSKTTILLTGELVLLADTEADAIENYMRQTDRITKSIGGFAKRTIPFTLKVWLHKSVIDAKHQLKRYRLCFAIDQYLHHGKAQKKNLRLVTGSSSQNETIIHIFTFEQGNLTSIEEKVLPGEKNQRFHADYLELLNTLRRDQQPITIADPLPNPESSQYSYIGPEIYKKPIQYFITDESAEPSTLTAHGIPLAVLFSAIAGYIGAMVIPYNEYSKAATQFQKIAASIPKNDLSFGSDQLKTMQERRLFLTETRTQQNIVRFLREMTFALSSEGVVIKNIELKPAKQKPEDPDIAISLQTKRAPGMSTLQQAKPILDRLSAKLGVNIHLAHNGYQTQKIGDIDYVQYNIEGNFKGQQ